MGIFKQRASPVTVLVSQRWNPGTYQTNHLGYEFPVIETVPKVGAVPTHGLWHGPEGDVIVNIGDYITLDPSVGTFSADSWYGFIGGYEEVSGVPN